MKNLIAKVTGNTSSLDVYANAINNGRTDGVYFYVNENRVSVSHPYSQLSEVAQREELCWFLNGKTYEIN